MSAKMDKFHTNQEQEIAKLRKEVAECHTTINNIWEYMCHKGEAISGLSHLSTGTLPPLCYPPPPTIPDAAPSPVSTVSNISSTSSSLPVVGTLNLDSPGTRTVALPVAGPSRVRWERTQVHGMSF